MNGQRKVDILLNAGLIAAGMPGSPSPGPRNPVQNQQCGPADSLRRRRWGQPRTRVDDGR